MLQVIREMNGLPEIGRHPNVNGNPNAMGKSTDMPIPA
jgi:hypothetical protein